MSYQQKCEEFISGTWKLRKKSANWINIGIKNEYFGNGDGVLMIEIVELFQLFNQDAIDKAILSAYCL